MVLDSTAAQASVKITKGITPIINGDAVALGDLTMQNAKIIISLGIETPAPWGMPKGSIIDGGLIRDGKIGADRVAFIDFTPDSWGRRFIENRKITATILKDTPEEGSVYIVKDLDGLEIYNTITLKKDDDKIYFKSKIVNNKKEALTDLSPGYNIWNQGGYWLNMPGLLSDSSKKQSVQSAMTDWAANYDLTWSMALHVPSSTHAGCSGRDLTKKVTLNPGDSLEMQAWVQIMDSGDISKALAFEILRKQIPAGTLRGTVQTTAGDTVVEPVVIVKKNDKIYVWSIGKDGQYSMELPEGDYLVAASAAGFAPSDGQKIKIKANQVATINFADVKLPGTIALSVFDKETNQPVSAKITTIEGVKPSIRFLGQQTFFTTLENLGQVDFNLPPGKYKFRVQSGAGFNSNPVEITAEVVANKTLKKDVKIATLFNPAKQNWYCADMHHHSDILDGETIPNYVMRSQLARRLDFTLLSDHDSAGNHSEMQEMSTKMGIPFLPSIEVSPPWGHFNAINVSMGKELNIADVTTTKVGTIFQEMRNIGAELIVVNHPYYSAGYFTAKKNGTLPGGEYSSDFDVVEINSDSGPKKWDMVIKKMHEYWDNGERYYLSAGTDTHNVWTYAKPDIRMYGYVENKPEDSNAFKSAFVRSIRQGNAYASLGPFVEPEVMFGSVISHKKGKHLDLNFEIKSVDKLKEVRLFSNTGQIVGKMTWDKDTAPVTKKVTFKVEPNKNTWYALEVDDLDGSRAWTNPIWVDIK